MDQKNVRNFSIIAHIDHGKSTLADRLLELTGTVEKRKMQEQMLDTMSIERERGITIKMQPVRMIYNQKNQISNIKYQNDNLKFKNNFAEQNAKIFNFDFYILNLIDTPGHVDFGYEVSRSLAAVEGAILLVDATKGVQAQTLANLEQARKQNLVIVPAVNKIDLPNARVKETKIETAKLLGISEDQVLSISGKTGEGVENLLKKVIEDIPPPKGDANISLRALIFDSSYDTYKGVIAHVRLIDGLVKKGAKIKFMIGGARAEVLETGVFRPHLEEGEVLKAGDIGYIATGLKDITQVRVGDTITLEASPAEEPLPGYREPQRVVFASFFPEDAQDYDALRGALGKLKLNDASFYFEPEQSDAFGRGFRCGFLGMLHMDIIRERLQKEHGIAPVITTPSVSYKIKTKNSNESIIFSPSQIKEDEQIDSIAEPYARLEILTDSRYLGGLMKLLEDSRGDYKDTKYLSPEKVILIYEAPLAEIIVDFYDQLKSATSGYASMNYEIIGWRENDLVKMDVLIAGDKVEALAQIVPRAYAEKRGRALVEKLKEIIPRQLFAVALQAAIGGKIIARTDVAALRKDVTGYLYGGDYSRKKKLLEKQKKGKKKMKALGKVDIPADVYFKVLKK